MQAGAYFLTILTHRQLSLFGWVVADAMELNAAGQAVAKCWQAIPTHYPHVVLDAFVVMPNHVHGILMILRDLGANVGANDDSPVPGRARGTSRTVGAIVRGFKIGVTKWMRQNTDVRDAWQRNYYELVIRSEQQLSRIRRYIADNPANWMLEHENPRGNCYGQGEKQQFFCG